MDIMNLGLILIITLIILICNFVIDVLCTSKLYIQILLVCLRNGLLGEHRKLHKDIILKANQFKGLGNDKVIEDNLMVDIMFRTISITDAYKKINIYVPKCGLSLYTKEKLMTSYSSK